ncbi:Zn-binding domain-containing protein, partial [Chloroflexota bacterium]
ALPDVTALAPRRAMPGRRRQRAARATPRRSATDVEPEVPPGIGLWTAGAQGGQGDDERLFGGSFAAAMVELENSGELEYRNERWYPRQGAYPAQDVSLRAMAGSRVALLNEDDNYRLLEEIEGTSALYRVHPGAIYLHQGESFLVRELDLDAGHAIAAPVEVNYYTQPMEINDVRVIRSVARKAIGKVDARLGEVQVTRQVTGYRRMQQFREEVLSVEDLDLPVQVFNTVALWWDVPRWVKAEVTGGRLDWAGGLHALEHAAIALLPLFAMCDRWDIGGLSTPQHPDTGEAQVFIYDGFPGGVGLAEVGFELLTELWQTTYDMVRECPCEAGCPSCVQSPKCGNNNEPLDKAAAVVILAELLRRV